MVDTQYQLARSFYSGLIDELSNLFPRFRDDNIGLLSVVHAFSDKIPLMDTLLDYKLLRGVVLKRSSSIAQPEIADTIYQKMKHNDIPVLKSNTTYATNLPDVTSQSPVILANHGGYGLTLPPHILRKRFMGITEHTLNGEEKLVKTFLGKNQQIPYLSTARVDLKERSDKEISLSIAKEIIQNSHYLNQSITAANSNTKILLIGYGTMGMHAAQGLRQLNCTAEITIHEKSDKKSVFALQDGFEISNDLEDILPQADFIILATNIIKGAPPVLTAQQLATIKDNACLISMTSMDDELRQGQLIAGGFITKNNTENNNGIYKGPSGKNLFLMADGSPANVLLPDGGVKDAMMLVEGAGLAGAFILSENLNNHPRTLPDFVGEVVAKEWLKHYHAKHNEG